MTIGRSFFGNSLAIPADMVVAARAAHDNSMNKPAVTSALENADSTLSSANASRTSDELLRNRPPETLPRRLRDEPKLEPTSYMNRHARRQMEALQRQRRPNRSPRPDPKKRSFSSFSRCPIADSSPAEKDPPSPGAPASEPEQRALLADEYAMRLAVHIKKVVNASGQFRALFRSDYGETPWTLAVLDPGLRPEQETAVLEQLPAIDPRFVALLEVHTDRVGFSGNGQRTEAVEALRVLVHRAVKGPAAVPAEENQP